jgi:hypothetical protein
MSAITENQSLSRIGKDVRVVFASSVWTVIALIAAVLLSRRLAGAFGSVPVALPCVAGTAATFFSLSAHALWSAANPGASGQKQAFAAALTVLLPLIVADVLWTTVSPLVGGYLAALFVLAGLGTLFMRDFAPIEIESLEQNWNNASVRMEIVPPPGKISRETPGSLDPAPTEEVALFFENAPDEESCDDVDPTLSQSIVRRRPAEGAEIIEGSVRIHFGPGERTTVAHVSFVPPLADRPRTECQVLTDFDGRVRIGLSQAYGLRIEARRAEPAGAATDVVVAFSAEVRAAQSEAA